MVGFVIQDRCSILIEVLQDVLLSSWVRHSGYTPDCVHERGLGKLEFAQGYVVIRPE